MADTLPELSVIVRLVCGDGSASRTSRVRVEGSSHNNETGTGLTGENWTSSLKVEPVASVWSIPAWPNMTVGDGYGCGGYGTEGIPSVTDADVISIADAFAVTSDIAIRSVP